MRLATDYTQTVADAFATVRDEITGALGREPYLTLPPRWTETDMGQTRRLSASWNLSQDGRMVRHFLAVDEYGRGPIGSAPAAPRRWVVQASQPDGVVRAVEITLAEPPTVDLIRHVVRMVRT